MTVTVYVPDVELARLQVDVWLPLMVEGAHDAVTPDGAEAAVSATAPVKPPVEVSEMVDVAD